MFCQECGTKNEDSSIFCQECGTKLYKPITNDSYSMINTPGSKKPRSKKTKIILGVNAVLLVVILSVYSIVKSQCSAEKAADEYFNNVINGKWAEVYDSLDITKSDFIDIDRFIAIHKDQDSKKLDTYKVGSSRKNKGSLSKEVVITYRLKGDSEQQYSITLNQQAKKRFHFFPSWKVNPSEYIRENYNIQVPNNTKVTFGNVELDENYIKNSDDYYTYYTLPKVFKGQYDIKVTQKNMNDIQKSVSTENGSFYLDNMTLKDELKKELVIKALKDILKFYQAGFSKSDFSEIANRFTSDGKYRSEAAKSYQNFVVSLNGEDGLGLQSVLMKSFSGDAEVGMYDAEPCVNVTLNYGYDVTYKANDFWTGETFTDTYSGNDTSSFTYIYENDNWVLKSYDFAVLCYYDGGLWHNP
jgi:Predicted membrane protein